MPEDGDLLTFPRGVIGGATAGRLRHVPAGDGLEPPDPR